MADMIEAKDAKQILGCDDATLNNHINSGAIRAQRVGGKLMLNKDDVDKLAGKDDDGTIVLTGDSDNLQIDLGKVVDDTSDTIVQSRKEKSSTESITFGDELEVVNFDDGKTSDLHFDDTKPTTAASGLSFTDSNTAVITSVEETNVGGATAPINFTTDVDQSSANAAVGSGESARRSVRSNRARAAAPKVHWIWLAVMILTVLVGVGFIAPYYVLGMWSKSQPGETATIELHGQQIVVVGGGSARGVDDNAWTAMAGGLAGFTVEPDREKYLKNSGGEWRDIREGDTQAEWRYRRYRTKDGQELKERDERNRSFLIREISADGKTAYTQDKKQSYPILQKEKAGATEKIIIEYVDVGWGGDSIKQ